MAVKICPRCQERYAVNPHTGDYIHQCNSGVDALDKESVLVVGDWNDYTGSAEVSPMHLRTAGTQNKLFGSRGDIEGEEYEDVNAQGKKKSMYRMRQHEEYIGG